MSKLPNSAYRIICGRPGQGDVFDWMRDPTVLSIGITREQLRSATVLLNLTVKKQFRGLGIGKQALSILVAMADAQGNLLLLKACPTELDNSNDDDDSEFAHSQRRLKKTFYQPFGFIELDDDWMVRLPTKTK